MSEDFKMIGRLSFGSPPCLYVTWEIPVFFQLAEKSGYAIESSEFSFADGDYCLRLFSDGDEANRIMNISLAKLNSTVPGRDVSYEFGLMCRRGVEFRVECRDNCYEITASERNFFFSLSRLKEIEDIYFTGGTVTVFCALRASETSSGASPMPDAAEIQFLQDSMVSSSNAAAANTNFRKGGKLSFGTPPFLHVTWKLPLFHQMAKGSEYTIESPEFQFNDCDYCLRVFSNLGDRDAKFELVNLTDGSVFDLLCATDAAYEVVLKSRTGKEISLTRRPEPYTLFVQIPFYIPRSDLKQNRDCYVPNRTLTVFCFVRSRQPKSDEAETSEKEEEQAGLRDILKLQFDYRQLLQKGVDSDVCFIVCGKEFRAHRCVLRVRSPVIDAMFDHDSAEKKIGQVIIDDLDPESFGGFLEYLYMGCVGAGLSDDNAFQLYQAADKYDVSTLRSKCVAHMLRYLSVDTFCNFIKMAVRHRDEDLLTPAVAFFKENRARIIMEDKIMKFLNENCTVAEDFLNKADASIE